MENRLGFHYFQDFNHYQSRDLMLWLPELQSLKTRWLVLKSQVTQAIPEEFIQGLVQSGITPIVHFEFQVNSNIKPDDLKVIVSAYSKWGIKYVVFFKSPNIKSAWVEGTWSNGDLVERFLDRYLSFVRLAEQNGMTAIFPPLQPGGDYWDLSFLKKLILLIEQRKYFSFTSNFHMAVSSQTFSHPLTWGLGATARWKSPRPYSKTEAGEEDHIGFNTWEWYLDLFKTTLNISPKFFLFWYGTSDKERNLLDPAINFESLLESTSESSVLDNKQIALPNEIVGCVFWLLSSSETDPFGKTAWFDENGKPLKQAISSYKEQLENLQKQKNEFHIANRLAGWMYPIDHYLLLPSYDWGVPETVIDRLRPIIRESRPTIGFSLIEALNARKVTVWNEDSSFSEHDLQMLRDAGCQVDEQVVKSIGIAV